MGSSNPASDLRRLGVALAIAFGLHALVFTLLHLRRGPRLAEHVAQTVAPAIVPIEATDVALDDRPAAAAPATVAAPAAPKRVVARGDDSAEAAPTVQTAPSVGEGNASGGATGEPSGSVGGTGTSTVGTSAMPGAGTSHVDRAALLSQILERVRNARRYPEAARRREIEGTVHVRFAVAADGRPQSISTNSGDPLLQNAAKEALERAAPLPLVDGPVDIDVEYRLSE